MDASDRERRIDSDRSDNQIAHDPFLTVRILNRLRMMHEES